jgi:septum formation protein
VPDIVEPADLDETPLKDELPTAYALRLAREKALRVKPGHAGNFVLAADTVVACGRRILPKPEDENTARHCLELLSGRRHRVHSGLALISPDGQLTLRRVDSQVAFKRLSSEEIALYLKSGEWREKAGGYAIQGRAAALIRFISGSYSNVVGLPLFETAQLLAGRGYRLQCAAGC